jgi:Domain of Unknown Function with PDB structure (DUF3857)/Transglutaminase-like superfamily
MHFLQRRFLAISVLLGAGLLIRHSARAAETWPPVDPAELALQASAIDSAADAEVLSRDVRVEDVVDEAGARTLLTHFVRIKIFNERGRDAYGTVTIPYRRKIEIDGITGRTIRRNGSIVMLGRDAVMDRTTLQSSGVKEREKAFAMPGVEPGAIIEYRYRELRRETLSNYLPLQFQYPIPVRSVTYHVRPAEVLELPMRSQTFHGTTSPFTFEDLGFFRTTATRLPAYREEPFMPPEDEVRMWMLIYYSKDQKLDPPAFWKEYGRSVYDDYKGLTRPTADVRKVAENAVAGAKSDEEKLVRLFDYCRSHVKNQYDDALGLTDADRAKLKKNSSPGETLKRGIGTGFDINMLFAALVTAAGYDARVAKVADRGRSFFSPRFADSYFLTSYDIAVRLGDHWRFLDPGTPWLPPDMLRWQEEGQEALVSDPRDPVFVETPVSLPERSREKFVGNFQLDADGALEGDVRIERTGHLARAELLQHGDDAPAEFEESVRKLVRARVPTAEVTAITRESSGVPNRPLVTTCHVRATGYAQRIGKRLLVQPAVFRRAAPPPFTASERMYPIYFPYPWAELDSVRITLPDGFTLDAADSPAPLKIDGVANYLATVGITVDGSRLHYAREFRFGDDGAVLYPPSTYRGLKKFFDTIAERDGHTLTLKQMESAAK